MANDLLGGRGPRQGPDALVGQDEGFDERLQRSPKQDEFWISNTHPLIDLTSNVVPGVDLLRLQLLPYITRSMTLRRVRISVTVAVASSTVLVGLYLYQREPVRRFRLIAGTEAAISSASVGQKDATLASAVMLQPNSLVAVALKSASAAVEVAGCAIPGFAGARPFPVYDVTYSGSMPKEVLLSTTTKNYGGATYAITYFSDEGVQML